MDLEINAALIEAIKNGDVILFFGAGASMGAINSSGNPIPGVKELTKKIADRFLDSSWHECSLSEVAEIAQSQNDRITVQKFIRDFFIDFEPCDFHIELSKYHWQGIYTTNYDLLIERAYSKNGESKQQLVPIYRTTDTLDLFANSNDKLPYTKLHGCITKVDEHDLSLILTPDQYITHLEGRDALFERVISQGQDKPILFIGHSLTDPDIRRILHQISLKTTSRPRYWALMYDFRNEHKSLWDEKRISLIKGSFETFMEALKSKITGIERDYVRKVHSHPLESKFVSNGTSLTSDAVEQLNGSINYIYPNMPLEKSHNPSLFYHGYSNDWSIIHDELDIRRTMTDEFIADFILPDEIERNSVVELFHLSGSAGSGKSVLLKRLAYDSAIDYERICLYQNSNEKIDVDILLEIAEKCGERIFVFIDKASSHTREILQLTSKAKKAKVPITCIVAERTNVWNTECVALHKYLNDSLPVRKLSNNEVNLLIDKLEVHKCLGALSGYSKEEQIKEFMNRLDRQLLVVLHEVTLAKRFEEIIADEYDNIADRKAQLIYRTVCIMNQFGVPVRAGLINRIHGISFKNFKESMFEPLENVLIFKEPNNYSDASYEARHPSIAQIVFLHAIANNEERLNSYLELVQSLDVGYSSDRSAFRELIKYRYLQDVFPNHDDIRRVYESCFKVCGHDDYYYQQYAIFYMRSKVQNFHLAEKNLLLAREWGRHNATIEHSFSELELLKAAKSSGLERERHYNKAERLARNVSSVRSDDSSYGHSTLCKVAIRRLEDALRKDDEELIADATNSAEQSLRNALDTNPDTDVILELDSKLASLLNDNDRAYKALKKAFELNNVNASLAKSLGAILISKEQYDEAEKVYKTALEADNNSKLVHGLLAMLYSKYFDGSKCELAEYHWRSSFTDGENNIVSQVWYARQLYLNGKYNEYLDHLAKMKEYRVPPLVRHSIRGEINDGGKAANIIGKVIRKDSNYLLIEASGYRGRHFMHISKCPEARWDDIFVGEELCYHLGFTLNGAAAFIA